MLKRLAAVFSLTLVLSSCSIWKNAPKGWSGATGGEQLERQLWTEIQAKNWSELEKHLEPNFVSTSGDTRWDRAGSIDRWKKYEIQSVNLADVQVKTAGTDFVVTATVTVNGTADGKPVPGPVQTMTVWQQVSKGFVAVAHADSLP
jgi:Domain of unknown function (DUF4440)